MAFLAVCGVVLVTLGAAPMALRDDGVQFPDGSVQTSAALGLAGQARAGLNHSCNLTMPELVEFTSCDYAVPPGKILVLEFVGVYFTTPLGTNLGAVLNDIDPIAGSALWLHNVPLKHETTSLEEVYEVAQPFRAYISEERELAIVVARNSTVGLASGFVSMSGYLVDAQP